MFYIFAGSKYPAEMKTMRYFPALALVLVAAGCSTTFRPWNLSEIDEGMDRTQVVQVLGKPDFSESKDGAEHLHYLYREDYNPSSAAVPFYNENTERAFRDLENEAVFREYEYVVILVDGKVINYKEL